MDLMEVWKAVILGIVEGITEWLPISSTGHMILLDEFLKMDITAEFKDMFLVVIQLGAILAVVILFWSQMWPFTTKANGWIKKDTFSMWFKVLAACIPMAQPLGVSAAAITFLITFAGQMAFAAPSSFAAIAYLYGVDWAAPREIFRNGCVLMLGCILVISTVGYWVSCLVF